MAEAELNYIAPKPTAIQSDTKEFVRHSLRECILNTTLRGPRRIVTSESRNLSCFWSCVCVASLLLLTVHFYKLVQAYLSYQTYMLQTDLEHDSASIFPTGFPDIVICPHQMFSSRALMLWSNGSVRSPWQQIQDYQQRIDIHSDSLLNLTEADLRILVDSFKYPASLSYYLNNLTDDEALKLGRGNEILIDCAVGTNGRKRTRHNCPIKLSKIMFRKYLVCLQVTVDPTVSQSTHEVSLFLDSGPRWESLGTEFMQHMVSYLHDYEQLGRGFTLWLKQNGRPFDWLSKRVFLQPGRVSRVTFKETVESKVSGPYPGICNNDPNYSKPQCIAGQFVRQVQNLCSCNYFEDSTHWLRKFPHCSELMPNLTKSLAQSKCVELAERNSSLFQRDTCIVPCKTHLYNMDVSSSEFDLPSWFLCWLQQPAIRIRNETESVHECLQNFTLCQEYATRLIKFLRRTPYNLTSVNQIFSNCNKSLFVNVPLDQVVSLVLYRSGEFPSMLRQQYIVTPPLLFSQIGGASSLYLGLSLTFFAEIFDWLARLVMFWTSSSDRKRRSSEGSDCGDCGKPIVQTEKQDDMVEQNC